MKINYIASEQVRNVIESLGRTEDIKFSPNNKRLAVAAYNRKRIAIFDISIVTSADVKNITFTSVAEIASTHLNYPHGLDFVDDETIIVTNREGTAPIFQLPPAETESKYYELTPLGVIGSGDLVNTPGSVSVCRIDRDIYSALICNNYAHNVTRHVLDLSTGYSVKKNEVLLKKLLDVPDGISISRDRQWIAVSNHNTHCVFLFENTPSLNEMSNPDGILRYVYYPHGLRFTADGRFIIVADAGAPYVHIYGQNGPSWRGVRKPLRSVRVLNDEDYLRGRHNPMEGGPKGIDIDNATNILVTTGEIEPLNFFDLATILQSVQSSYTEEKLYNSKTDYALFDDSYCHNKRAFEVRYELDILSKTKEREEARVATLTNSWSWRITAPLRWLWSFLRNPH